MLSAYRKMERCSLWLTWVWLSQVLEGAQCNFLGPSYGGFKGKIKNSKVSGRKPQKKKKGKGEGEDYLENMKNSADVSTIPGAKVSSTSCHYLSLVGQFKGGHNPERTPAAL